MADQTDTNLDAFLGTRTAPAWQRYAKWGAIAVGVILLLLLLQELFRRRRPPSNMRPRRSQRGDLTVSASRRRASWRRPTR